MICPDCGRSWEPDDEDTAAEYMDDEDTEETCPECFDYEAES
jgi:hypothetical protein